MLIISSLLFLFYFSFLELSRLRQVMYRPRRDVLLQCFPLQKYFLVEIFGGRMAVQPTKGQILLCFEEAGTVLSDLSHYFTRLLRQQGNSHCEQRSALTRAVAIINCHYSEIASTKKDLQFLQFFSIFFLISLFWAHSSRMNRSCLKSVKGLSSYVSQGNTAGL